jgi:beta-phosphoglucomutase-like phosphatase (HAD superfamily)
LFDLDGTIIKSTFKAREAKGAVIERIGKLDFDTTDISIEDTMADILQKAEEQAMKYGRISIRSLRKKMSAVLDKFDAEALSQ